MMRAVGFGLMIALCASVTGAGSLTPPAGPVSPTPGPEPRKAINATNTPGDADSVFKITQPGSYYLAGNLAGVVGKHGIEIAASGVTIDLMGFDLAGVPAMGAFDGISVTVESLANITIRNGSVRGWGSDGVFLATDTVNSRVDGVLATQNLATGIKAGFGAVLTGCSAIDNGGNGITTGTSSVVSNCSSHRNLAIGISAGSGTALTSCTARDNATTGISCGNGCTLSACTSITNTGIGISMGSSGAVIGCVASFNGGDGMNIGLGSTVSECSCYINDGDGIEMSNNCTALRNTCSTNGNSTTNGAGVKAAGFGNVIDGNIATGNFVGIQVFGTHNLIVRNTCSANFVFNFNFVAGNNYGPIMDRIGATGVAVSGNSAATTLNTLDPAANFAY